MNFRPDLAAKVMAGEKTVTRRATSANPRSPWSTAECGLKVGRSYAVCPGRGKNAIGRVKVLTVSREPLGMVDEQDAKLEGFESLKAFRAAWAEINGVWCPTDPVWRVRFSVTTDG